MYADTGVAGVGKDGIDSWLQYALRTWRDDQYQSTESIISYTHSRRRSLIITGGRPAAIANRARHSRGYRGEILVLGANA